VKDLAKFLVKHARPAMGIKQFLNQKSGPVKLVMAEDQYLHSIHLSKEQLSQGCLN
jgi:hypothetical protein